ncbi:MAG: phenylalanine--tRNA ligase subunit beta, partial [Bacteroidia bacterium]|nr:phenylalanine--tRNA ligase subunit beta [Bacteroidia bacterium]
MKISYNWLKKLIQTDKTAQEISTLLTACGLEVEALEKFEAVPGGLKGIVVGEVVEKEKHPDADKLSVTKVNIGGPELLNIVCGAPNVAAGQKVLVATVGCTLYPTGKEPFEIKKSKIRGAVSEGMICAEDEIGLGTDHDGIMVLDENAVVGIPAADYFNTDSYRYEEDLVFEIGLTPNRSDAASHYGVARDLAAVLNCTENEEKYSAVISGTHELPAPSGTLKTEVEILNPEACKRYSGVTITGITVKDSPDWLKNSLKAIGLRPINNVVDVTNYVLHELGQPLHAFDAFKIKGNKILVKKEKEGTVFKTLDGVERKLSANDLMISSADGPMCIAGVFGGMESGVTESTVAVFLESAYFDAGHVRASSKFHGLKTDASFRFERGTDPEMTIIALTRAAHLILELTGGRISSEIVDIYPVKLAPSQVAFSYQTCFDLIGKEIPKNTVKIILRSLGIEIAQEGADGLLLNVPLYKSDVTREVDVIEEVMRVYGYNNIEESGKFSFSAHNKGEEFALKVENTVADLLSANGFREIMSTSLTKETYYSASENFKPEENVKVLNPLSADLNLMRRSLLFGGLETISYNTNRKNADLKLYEFGRTYSKNSSEGFKYSEEKHLTLFVCGRRFPENPYGENSKENFSSLKSYVNVLLQRIGIINYKSTEAEHEHFSAGLTYSIKKDTLVTFGQIKKSICKQFDLKEEIFCADISWDNLLKAAAKTNVTYTEVSKFPGVRRDLALLLNKNIKYKEIEELAFTTERKFLK